MRQILLISALAATAAHAETPAIGLLGRGAQLYVCAPSQTAFACRFVSPEATLFNAAGTAVARHYAGPTWQSQDGSVVTGPLV